MNNNDDLKSAEEAQKFIESLSDQQKLELFKAVNADISTLREMVAKAKNMVIEDK